MSDTSNHDDHWRRLAAELGLDAGPLPEQSPPSAPPPEPVAREEVPAFREAEAEPSRGRRRRSPEPEELPLEPAPVEDVGLFAPAVEAEIEGADVEASAVPEVRPDAAEEASDDLADQQGSKRRRRRRPRRKKKGDGPAETAAGEEQAAHDTAADPARDDDDEPVEDLARNWNVPSWDELIGSLYRPER
jgi:hypothetical protein